MRILLVRHGHTAPAGRTLSGRRPGVHLSDGGRVQAARLAGHLKGEHIAVVYSSPVERAVETANAIGDVTGAPVELLPALTEFDFGAWTGREIAALRGDALWQHFTAYRSGTRAPDGELALEAQARAMTALYRLAEQHAEHTIVAVSHAEVIRCMIAHLLGIPIDMAHRVEIEPGSMSTVELHPWGARVLGLNFVVH